MNLIYVPLIGFPLCLMCMFMGCLFCLTIIGIPIGLACFALGFRVVALR